MTTYTRVYIAAGVILAAGLIAACGGDDEPAPPSAQPTATQAAPTATSEPTQEPAAEPTAGNVESADIRNSTHQDLTVTVGTTVTWTSRDRVPHTTTSGTPSDPTGVWDSPTLSQDDSFPFTFNEVGTFQYFCRIHPTTMQATVTVVAADSTSEEPTPTATAVPPEPTATSVAVAPPSTPTPAPPPPTETPMPEATEAPTGPEPVTVDIQYFEHQDVTISVGDTVMWVQKDRTTHTTTSGTPEAPTGVWDSGNLNQGGVFSFTFNEPGVFEYFCSIHNTMTATVTVTEGEGAATAPTATETPTPIPTPTTTPEAEPVSSNIQGFKLFDLDVPVGTTVTWVNKDSAPHTTTSGEPPDSPSGVWDSGILTKNGEFSFTFTEEGVFEYYCDVHGASMTARVVVGDAAVSSSSGASSGGGGNPYGYGN